MGFQLGRMFVLADLRVFGFSNSPEEDLTNLILGVAGVENLHFVNNDASDDATVRAFDKAVLVDASEAGQGRNQTDVRAFQ